ncbi:hypothetical protein HIM_09031 [Hirsutella minnesotensis 3608]|uniref:Uncharacterized protein n=1 Tax=Hirsutella minnesotensis 3608 TaxID=1043627 RepID=A0A0F7ZXZ1_9HYPO|nr:hypothetical protein HIM_09031 [Hirsutella minnesotensis 3608]
MRRLRDEPETIFVAEPDEMEEEYVDDDDNDSYTDEDAQDPILAPDNPPLAQRSSRISRYQVRTPALVTESNGRSSTGPGGKHRYARMLQLPEMPRPGAINEMPSQYSCRWTC